MAKIALHGRHGEGKFALVDDDRLGELSQYRWLLGKNGYVYTSTRPKATYLHHLVLGIYDPDMRRPVDHINRNKLDNRAENLRRTTPAINLLNRPLYRGGQHQTGVKFVYPDKTTRGEARFVARPSGRRQKTFTSVNEAAAYVSAQTEG